MTRLKPVPVCPFMPLQVPNEPIHWALDAAVAEELWAQGEGLVCKQS